MPWFKVDDSAHAHPKMRRAGKAAIGLWVMCGSYAAAYLTDGMIPAETAAEGTATQIAKLVKVGLWHDFGHSCPRCPQPASGDYVMHDYLRYNPSRSRVLAERDREAEKKRHQRAGGQLTEAASPKNGTQNGPDSSGKTSGKLSDFAGFSSPIQDELPGHSLVSPGDSASTHARASQPVPTQVVPPTEVLPTDCAGDRPAVPFIGDRPRIPANSRPLVDAITAAGMIVGWDLQASEWFLIEALISRCGIDVLVDDATKSWHGSREPVRSGKYFIPAWRKLPDIPEEVRHLPAIASGPEQPRRVSRQQQEDDDLFARAMQRAITKDQQEAS